MCRLLAFSSLERKSFYDVVGNEFDKFVAMSSEHKDGWGYAHDGQILKDVNPAHESDSLTQAKTEVLTDGALLHLRLASKGITVNIDNNHPFTYGTTTFMHNGTIHLEILQSSSLQISTRDFCREQPIVSASFMPCCHKLMSMD